MSTAEFMKMCCERHVHFIYCKFRVIVKIIILWKTAPRRFSFYATNFGPSVERQDGAQQDESEGGNQIDAVVNFGDAQFVSVTPTPGERDTFFVR